MKRPATLTALLLTVAIAGLWLANRPTAEPAGATGRADGERPTPPPPGNASAPRRGPGEGGKREPAAPPGVDAASGHVVLRGRCVDPGGEALNGITASVQGRDAGRWRLDPYRRDHGEVLWNDPEPVETGTDGRFELRFVPPPPYRFTLWLRGDRRATLTAQWYRLEPGTVKDLGDVVMPAGVRVTGRVVDPAGRPRAEVDVLLGRGHRDRDGPGPLAQVHTASGRDGTFQLPERLAPGRWSLGVRYATPAGVPEDVVLQPPGEVLDLTVVAVPAPDCLRGRVVDDHGDPVHGARIEPLLRREAVSPTAVSGADGTFRLARMAEDDPGGGFRLRVQHEQHEVLVTGEPVSWGEKDLHLVLQRGLDLRFHVRRAGAGAPVEAFGLRLLDVPGDGERAGSGGNEVRGGWHHEGGTVLVEGVRRGRYRVLVEPRAGTGLARSDPLDVGVRDDRPRSHEVWLRPRVTQRVRVAHRDGRPVAGSTVELIEPVGPEPVDSATRAEPLTAWRPLPLPPGILEDVARTDGDGECTVAGARDREYALRVRGEGHAPVVRTGIGLPSAPLEILVSSGARVQVAVDPEGLLADLRRIAGHPRDGLTPEATRPGVRLVRTDSQNNERVPPCRPARFDTGGTAVLRDVPPGTWDVVLEYQREREGMLQGSAWIAHHGLVLEEGRPTRLELAERFGHVHGRLTVDGEPRQGRLQLRPPGDGIRGRSTVRVDADGSGRWTATVPPGTWQVRARIEVGEGTSWVPGTGPLEVVSGRTTRADLDVALARAEVRLLRPDGTPAEGLTLRFTRAGERLWAHCPPTDAHGRTTVTATPGTAVPRLRVRSLTDREAYRAWRRDHGEQPGAREAVTITLPILRLLPGEGESVELRLPAAWDR